MMDFLKNNKAGVTGIAAAGGILVLAFAMQGCSLGSMIKHPIPSDMQEFNGGEAKVSLNDAPFVLEDYQASVERNIRQFVAANEQASLLFDFLNSAVTIGVEEMGNSPIPGASLLSGLFLGFAGLMIRKPGTAKEVAREKEASYNAGQERAAEMAKQFVSEENMRAMVAALKAEGSE